MKSQKNTRLISFLVLPLAMLCSGYPDAAPSAGISLPLRTRIQPFHSDSPATEARFNETIDPSHTAIIITDMWDLHWCHGATRRVRAIA